jgi:soluble lytic murein transglycosylase-like protein
MESILSGRKILIVEGLTLTSAEIREVLANEKAQAFVARDVAAAFRLLDRVRFDAVLIDHSLHNEAIDLCIELRSEGIPHVSCRAPNSWQGWSARKRDAEYAVEKLRGVLSRIPVGYADATTTMMKSMSGGTRPA